MNLTEWLAQRESLGVQELRPALGRARSRAGTPACRRLVDDGRRLGGLVVPLTFRGQSHGVLIALDRLRGGPGFTGRERKHHRELKIGVP